MSYTIILHIISQKMLMTQLQFMFLKIIVFAQLWDKPFDAYEYNIVRLLLASSEGLVSKFRRR